MNFCAEYQEDKFIFHNLTLPQNGFYVDIGAMRPDVNSNTAFLRELGWKGLVIDGHHGCAKHWESVPGCTFVNAVISDGKRPVKFKHDRERSMIVDEAETESQYVYEPDINSVCPGCHVAEIVETRTLHELLEHVDRIDFLSIDIEGEEFNAMTLFDFNRFQPAVIVAEYACLKPDGSVQKDYRLRDMLTSDQGLYKVAHKTQANLIYTLR